MNPVDRARVCATFNEIEKRLSDELIDSYIGHGRDANRFNVGLSQLERFTRIRKEVCPDEFLKTLKPRRSNLR